MLSHLKRSSLLLPLLLAGCGESINGAYEASIQYADEAPRVAGIAVFQDHRIIADGQTVEVKEWREEAGTITAYGPDDKRLAQFTRNEAGDLVQALPMSRVIYKRYKF